MEDDALQRSIVMIKSGDYEGGADILYSLVDLEPENELAWLWLAACIENTDEKIVCLNQVLAINPENEVAQEALEQLMLSPDVDNIVAGQPAADGRGNAAARPRRPRPRPKKKQKINPRTLIIGAVVILVVGCIAVAGLGAAGWYLWTNF
ncbi:MAG: tetratricopeptide repeat protein [Anaerolineales bacterium]|nr:tetratricopeptide repeat protein [Anaerolineales bacterium]